MPSYCGIGFLQGSFRAFDEYARIIDDSGFWAVESKSNPIDGVLNVGPTVTAICKSLDEFGIPTTDYGAFGVNNALGPRVGSMAPYSPSGSISFSSGHLITLGGINGRLHALGGDQAMMIVDLGAPTLATEEHSACSGTADNCTLQASAWDGWGIGYTFHTSGTVLPWIDGTAGVSDYDTGFGVGTSWCYSARRGAISAVLGAPGTATRGRRSTIPALTTT